MKGYVVALYGISESVAVACRCIESAAKFGVDVEQRAGVWRDDAMEQMRLERLRKGKWDESWSNTEAVIGNFVAQYRIWREIEKAGTGALVLEHDAVFVASLPNLRGQGDIITLGKPSFGRLKPKTRPGFHSLFSTADKIPGAHGYYVTARGAHDLALAARNEGVEPVDKFINPNRFPDIREYWPWPIEAHDSFTTIQKEKGCLSKHAYKPGKFRIF